jgi:hypothetical protein
MRFKGYIYVNWTVWLSSICVSQREDGNTILIGAAVDQAALQGLLDYLFGLGIILLSLKRMEKSPIPNPRGKLLNEIYRMKEKWRQVHGK